MKNAEVFFLCLFTLSSIKGSLAGDWPPPDFFQYDDYRSVNRIPYEKNGRWGYCDTGMEQVIPTIYDEVGLFMNGYAKVRKKSKWGFINPSGKEICNIKYSWVFNFREDYACVVDSNGLVGFINCLGEETIPCKYDMYMDIERMRNTGFVNGRAKVVDPQTGKQGFIDRSGYEVIPLKYFQVREFREGFAVVREDHNNLSIYAEDRYDVIDTMGKIRFSFYAADIDYGYFNEGRLVIDINKKRFVVFDTEGNYVQKREYDYMHPWFYKGLQYVKKGGLAGYINRNGIEIIPVNQTLGYPFASENGRVWVKQNGRCLLIDSIGDVFFKEDCSSDIGFYQHNYFHYGLCQRQDQQGKCYFINLKGEKVLGEYDDSHLEFYAGGITLVSKDHKQFYIDTTGKEYRSEFIKPLK